MGHEERYEILNVLDFTSVRKRMGVVVRAPDGRLKLLVKGADNVIFERLAETDLYKDITCRHLDDFASNGERERVNSAGLCFKFTIRIYWFFLNSNDPEHPCLCTLLQNAFFFKKRVLN